MNKFFKMFMFFVISAYYFNAQAETSGDPVNTGVYADQKVGLMWQRCSLGQTWNGYNRCYGQRIKLNHADAIEYVEKFVNTNNFGGYDDWRIPTIEELATIRDCSTGWEMATEWKSELTMEGRKEGYVNTGKPVVVVVKSNGLDVLELPKNCGSDYRRPAIDVVLFPESSDSNFVWDSYRSSTENIDGSYSVFGVYVPEGRIDVIMDSHPAYVRLVRTLKVK